MNGLELILAPLYDFLVDPIFPFSVIFRAFLVDFRERDLRGVSLHDLFWESHMKTLCLFSW
jgi:hypothetical protein